MNRKAIAKEQYLKAGYTHLVSYKKFVKTLGWVDCEYPTTQDAAKLHVYYLNKDEYIISNVTVKEI